MIPNYTIINYKGINIKVEQPDEAIKVKKMYILSDKSLPGVIKHLKDLILLNVDRKELVDIIDKSSFYKKEEKTEGKIEDFFLLSKII
jgi:hypothetical protein